MVELRTPSQIPQVCLVKTVAALPQVDRLELRVDGLEALAPRLVVVHTEAERERVARADDAGLSRWHGASEVVVGAEPLRVGPEKYAGPVHVWEADVRPAHPAQRFVVARIGRLAVRSAPDLVRDEQEARPAFEEGEECHEHHD